MSDETYTTRDMSVAGIIGMLVGGTIVGVTAYAASPEPAPLPEPVVVTATPEPEHLEAVGCYEDEFAYVSPTGLRCVPIDDVVPAGPFADEWAQTSRPAGR